jgi:hypothetical protein
MAVSHNMQEYTFARKKYCYIILNQLESLAAYDFATFKDKNNVL